MSGIMLFAILFSGYQTPDSNVVIGKYTTAIMFSYVDLDLDNNGTFLLVSSSCTYDLLIKGIWKINGDTLMLEKFEFSDSKNKIWIRIKEPSDYFVIQQNKLVALNKIDNVFFATDFVMDKVTMKFETKSYKGKRRRKK